MGYYETMKKGEFMAAPWEPYLSSEANRYANLFGVCVSSDAKVEPGPQEPEPCVDDPMGYVAADAHTSCSDVDALGGSWPCDSLDPDFNGVQNIYVYELCPRSCGRCESDSGSWLGSGSVSGGGSGEMNPDETNPNEKDGSGSWLGSGSGSGSGDIYEEDDFLRCYAENGDEIMQVIQRIVPDIEASSYLIAFKSKLDLSL